MKKIIYITIFILISFCMILQFQKIIINKTMMYDFNNFYKEDKNINIDVFLMGSSHMYFSMSPMEIWQKYGIVSYHRGTASQYYKLSYKLMEEVFKYYKPKLIVFDIYMLINLSFIKDTRTDPVLASIDGYKFKYNAYFYIYKDKKEVLKRINTFNKFHSRWKDLNEYDFHSESYWKGKYYGTCMPDGSWHKQHLIGNFKYKTNDKVGILNEETIIYAEKMVELAKINKAKLLFIKLPEYEYNGEYHMQYNAFEQLAKQKGWDFIDYNKLYSITKLNTQNDFRDIGHLNLYGARKVMDHLIPYIIDNYNIPIHKGDPKYKKWDEDYIKYARAINREEIRELPDFNRWKNQAFYDNYTVMISSNGNVMNKLPQDIKSILKSKGLNKYNTDKANIRYAAIIDDNKVFYEAISENPVEYKGRMKRKVNLLVKSDGNSIINVSGKPRSKNKYGLNMVVYDKVNKEVVDSIWIDPNKPNEIRR